METCLIVALETWIEQYYLGRLLERKLRSKWISGLLILAVNGIGLIGKNRIGIGTLFEARNDLNVVAEFVINIGVAALIAACLYRAALWRKWFAVLTMEAVGLVCGALHNIVSCSPAVQKLRELLWDTWRKASADGAGAAGIYYAAAILLVDVFYVFALLLYFFLLRNIVRNFREQKTVITGRELLFLLMPSLTALLTTAFWYIVQLQGREAEDIENFLLAENSSVLFVLMLVMMSLLLAGILHGVKLYQNMILLGREKNSRAVLEQQVGSLQEHIRETERLWDGIRSLKHDMNNALAVAERLAGQCTGLDAERGDGSDAGQSDGISAGQLREYLTDLNRTVKSMESVFHTGNAVADILLEMKCRDALQRMPGLQVDAEELIFPENLRIRSYDIGVILGNALDNALEACRKLRRKEPEQAVFVRLFSVPRGRTFLMGIENSFDGRVLRQEGEEFPVTEKADREMHGIGLVNVKRACEKYHGAVEWEARGKVFVLTVLLKNEECLE